MTIKIQDFAKKNNIQLVSWGENVEDTYNYNAIIKEISLPFTDKASIENAINAYIYCLEIGIAKEKLKERIRSLEQIEMRFEIKQGINNSILINDSYSNDYTSLEIALDNLNQQRNREKLVILSDLQQSSINKEELYYKINTLLLNKGIENLVAIGKDFNKYQDLILVKNKKFF